MRSSFEASKSVRRSKTSSDRPRSCGGVEIPVTATMEVLPPEPGSAAGPGPGSADEASAAQAFPPKAKGKPSGGVGSVPRSPHAKGREKLSKCHSETSIRLSSTVLRHSSAEGEQPVFLTGVTAGMDSEDPDVLAAITDAEVEMQRDAGGATHIPSEGEWYPALPSSGGPVAAGTVKILRSDPDAKPAAVRYSAGSSQDTSSGRTSRRSASRERASMRASASVAAAPRLQEPHQGRYAAASSSVESEMDGSLRDSITLGQPSQAFTDSDFGGPVAHGQPCEVSLTESDLGGPVAHGQPCQVSLTESDLGGPVAHGQPCQVSLSRDDSASGSAVAGGGRGANDPEDSDDLNPMQSHDSQDVMNVLKGALERSRLAQLESSEGSSEEEGDDERLLRGSLALNPMQSPESSAASIGDLPAASADADKMEVSAENPLMASIPSAVCLQAAASGEGEPGAAACELISEAGNQADGEDWDEEEDAEVWKESERDSAMLDAMPRLQAEQQERRQALEGHVARLQEVKDEEGEQLVLFPSDFSALVQSLFQNKVGQDRTEELEAEKRALKGKQQAVPEEDEEKGETEEDAELRSGMDKILKLDRILSKKTEKAEEVKLAVHGVPKSKVPAEEIAAREERALARLKQERKRLKHEARVRRAMQGGRAAGKGKGDLSTVEARNMLLGPAAKFFHLQPEDEALVNQVLETPVEESTNPFDLALGAGFVEASQPGTVDSSRSADADKSKVDGGMVTQGERTVSPSTDVGSLVQTGEVGPQPAEAVEATNGEAAEERPEGNAAPVNDVEGSIEVIDLARLEEINVRLREYGREHTWNDDGMMADFGVVTRPGTSLCGDVTPRSEAASAMAPGRTTSSSAVSHADSEASQGDHYLAERAAARAAAQAERDLDAAIRALRTERLPQRLGKEDLAALLEDCRRQQDALQRAPSAADTPDSLWPPATLQPPASLPGADSPAGNVIGDEEAKERRVRPGSGKIRGVSEGRHAGGADGRKVSGDSNGSGDSRASSRGSGNTGGGVSRRVFSEDVEAREKREAGKQAASGLFKATGAGRSPQGSKPGELKQTSKTRKVPASGSSSGGRPQSGGRPPRPGSSSKSSIARMDGRRAPAVTVGAGVA